MTTCSPVAVSLGSLEALDRLNSYVRSPAYRAHYFLANGPRRAVYEMKRTALEVTHAAGIATHRRIVVKVRCRDCGGTGRYVDRDGQEYDHCYACDNGGSAILRFIESTLAERFVWHTPFGSEPQAIRTLFPSRMDLCMEEWEASWEPASDWDPNRPGQDLTPVEAAEALLLAEDAFPPAVRKRARYDSRVDEEENYYRTWRLFVGNTETLCNFCKATEGLVGFSPGVGRIRWHAYVCRDCSKAHGVEMFTQTPCPPDFLDSEPIRRWIERHPVNDPYPFRSEARIA